MAFSAFRTGRSCSHSSLNGDKSGWQHSAERECQHEAETAMTTKERSMRSQ
jgi:hypothetical protein